MLLPLALLRVLELLHLNFALVSTIGKTDDLQNLRRVCFVFLCDRGNLSVIEK